MRELHEERSRAESFGIDAEAYDRARPSYPTELVTDLLAERPQRVLDVGCGTGIAGRLFTERGCTVMGVEPDPRMADVARRHGIDVDVSTFESWEQPADPFDLLICGQAWHWIDPVQGSEKAGRVLRLGGRIAVFFNLYGHDPGAFGALREVYEQHTPGLASETLVLGTSRDLLAEQVNGLRTTGLFDAIEHRSYTWQASYPVDDWLALMATQSDHLCLPPATLDALLDDVRAVIEDRGGALVVNHETPLLTAVRI